jgi:hypothetical protein
VFTESKIFLGKPFALEKEREEEQEEEEENLTSSCYNDFIHAVESGGGNGRNSSVRNFSFISLARNAPTINAF